MAAPEHGIGASWRRSQPVVALVLGIALSIVSWAGHAAVQDPPATLSSEQVRVGIYVSPPFVMKDKAGAYSGMAIDLWESAASALGWNYSYVEKPTFGALTGAVAAGELDVAITNLTVTRERAEQLDFTHPWYDAGMRIMISGKGPVSGGAILGALGRSGHLDAYAGLALLALLATVLLTLFDRRFDPDFPRSWRHGLADSFYHVISIGATGKTQRKLVRGAAGRVLAAMWLLFGVAVVAYVTSSVTSVMTTLSLTHHINDVADLAGKTIGVLEGSTAEEFARAKAFDYRRYEHVEDAVQGLGDGSIIAVVADAPVLEYYAHRNPGSGVVVVGNTFSPDKYGFGVRIGADIGRPLRLQLLGMQEAGYMDEVRARYFGADR